MSLKYIFIFIAIIYSINGCLKTKPKKNNTVFTETNQNTIKNSQNNVYDRRNQVALEGPNNSSTSYNNPYPDNTLDKEVKTNNNIHLQIQAVEDYKVARKIKDSLELKSGQFGYIKKGRLNKVVIGGIKSEKDANYLRDTQYPGSFIVYPENNELENNYPAKYDDNDATSNDDEDNNYYTGIAIQLGAFRDKATAHKVSADYTGEYQVKIMTAIVNGATLYKVLIIGFETREEAERESINSNLSNFYIKYI